MTQTPNKNKPTPESTEWVTLARVIRPQGRKGELLAEILTDFPERFAERKRLFLRAQAAAALSEVTLEEHWLHKGRLVLKFAGVDSIEAVDLLRGHDIVIPRDERAPLDEDSVYIGDLVGCVFYDRTSAVAVGEIVDVDRESSNLALIVVRPAAGRGDDLLFPFAMAYQPHIDLEGRRMEMTLPEGLLALNSPLTPEERLAFGSAQAGHEPDLQNTLGPLRRSKKRR